MTKDNDIKDNNKHDTDEKNDSNKHDNHGHNHEKIEAVPEHEPTELEKTKEELKTYKDMLIRTQADFENYRKRTESERISASKREVEKLICKLLQVTDNLERALASAKETNDTESLIKGIELTEKTLKEILKKEGVEPIECLDREFSPHEHEAMLTIEDQEKEDNTVCEVFEKGYKMHDKIIRPAKVKVVKNG